MAVVLGRQVGRGRRDFDNAPAIARAILIEPEKKQLEWPQENTKNTKVNKVHEIGNVQDIHREGGAQSGEGSVVSSFFAIFVFFCG